ncbi:autotransporter domain-containing protein [Rhodopseudomonas palustris]|uniref:autotransporter domain-containing protein n=1 Tax=Rhodopseudomonas palustris TaxID=1076 RepID=UPI0003134EB9
MLSLGATLGSAQAQFTRVYGFGDSYADTGTAPGGAFRLGHEPCVYPGVCSFTGSTTFVQTLQSLYAAPEMVNYAIGGARTSNSNTLGFLGSNYGFPYELARLAHDGVRFTDRDLIALSIGGNDSSQLVNDVGAARTLGTQAAARAVNGTGVGTITGTFDGVTYNDVATYGVQQLVAAGARNIAWFSAGNSKYFPEPEGGAAVQAPARDAFAHTYYQELQTLLRPMAQAGVRIFLFNYEILQRRIFENAAIYGFSAVPGCEANGGGSIPQVTGCFYENSVHPTGAAMALIASYMANQIDAPTTVVPQGSISTALATGFTGSVFGRLDAQRSLAPFGLGSALAYAGPPKAAPAANPADRWSIYGAASYANGSRDRQFYGSGYDYNSVGGIFGAEYRLDQNWRVGGVFGYSQPDVELGVQNARERIDAYQFAGYASYADAHWFADGLLGYGRHDFALQRQGIIDTIRGNTRADVFTVAGKAGYLFDVGQLRVGPLASLTYSNAQIDGYTETGDVLLTMTVDRQRVEALTGDTGVQLRYPLLIGGGIYSPFVNLTAAHDFIGEGRTITTMLVSAPLLPILTPVAGDGRTYGRVAAGVSALVSGNVSATLTVGSTFARSGGDDLALSGGVKLAF